MLTENIIILNNGTDNIVKEGNRRVAALKLIHGHYKLSDFGLPASIVESINKLDSTWKAENLKVPCTVFTLDEEAKVDKVVTLAHGKGEKASRDPWNSVARARHNRDVKGASEHGLDLLEKYLKKGNNLNGQQKERWGGEYPLTVLDEALRKSFSRLAFSSVAELVKKYPQITQLAELESILLDIGLEQIKFETLRNVQLDFPTNYGIAPIVVTPPLTQSNNPQTTNTAGSGNSTDPAPQSNTTPNSNQITNSTTSNNSTPTPVATTTTTPAPPKAVAVNDPKHVAQLLKKFSPRGANRQKVVTLRDEIKKLKIANNPIAFCFLLRSMFEISGKAYSADHSLSMKKSGGKDKTLVEVLRGTTAHLTNNNSNTQMVKVLHGAMTELGKPDGLLSVTSMNNLVHSPVFTISQSDLCTIFSNIYPLLEAMN